MSLLSVVVFGSVGAEAFTVFDIKSCGTNMQAHESLIKIAKTFSLEVSLLKSQFEAVLPRARHLFRRPDTLGDTWKVNKDAWQTAIGEIEALRKASARKIDVTTLRQALQAYFVCGISSSGVEQRFSKVAASFSDRQSHCSADTESMITKLVTDLPLHPSDQIDASARSVWLDCFGAPRKPYKRRMDEGVPKTKSHKPMSDLLNEHQFLKKRRLSARAAAAPSLSASSSSAMAPAAPAAPAGMAVPADGMDDMWGPRHDKFLLAVQQKQQVRTIEAVAEGTLHAGELPADELRSLQAKAKERTRKQVAAQRDRERKDAAAVARHYGVPGPGLFASLRGHTVSVALVVDRAPGLDACLAAHHMAETAILDATLIIADHTPGNDANADKKEIKAHIVAGYFGKILTTPQFLLSAGNSGACLKFDAFREKRKHLYFTHACRARFGFQIKLLEKLCTRHKHSVSILTGELVDFKKKSNVRVVALNDADVPDKTDHPMRSLFSVFIGTLLQASTNNSALGF